jgi:sugar lactone lactonase YvrE
LAHLRGLTRALVCAAFAFSSVIATANPPAVDRGVTWLSQQARADGTVAGEAASIATAFQTRTETLTTLKQFSTAPTALADLVSTQSEDGTEYLARKIATLAPVGRNVSASVTALGALQNADGGFGGAAGYQSNALDTAFALLALRAAGSTSGSAASNAIAYLVASQGTDGSFAINEQSTVYVTSYALQALNAFAQTNSVTNSVQSAKNWLVSAQTAGAYAAVLDNALAAIALVGSTTDTTAYAGTQVVLNNSQLADGSWSDDPYLTSIVIRALVAAGAAPPPSTTGQIGGTVVDASTGTSLAGVLAQASGAGSASATTNASGAFAIGPLNPGTYSVQFSLSGYGTITQPVTVTAGATSNLGTVRLPLATGTAALQGVVKDGSTGLAVTGATVSVGSLSAQTDGTGGYRIAGVSAGAATVAVSLTGYQTISVGATFTSGATLFFSPSLYATGVTIGATTESVLVVSSGSSQAIAGATVSASSATAVTDASGKATLTGLTQGMATIQASAAGYLPASATVLIANGANTGPTLALAAATQSITLSGTITDSVTTTGIGGAAARVLGTALTATTDASGHYQVSGITSTQFTVSISAPGYASQNLNVSLSLLADARLDAALVKSQQGSGGLVVTGTTTDSPTYPPFSEIETSMLVQNTTTAAQTLNFTATLSDSNGVMALQATNHPFTLAASATTNVDIDLHNTSQAPGNYSLLVQGFDSNGSLAVEGSASLAILPVARISGAIVLTPPVAQAGATQPISIAPTISNHGNLVVPAGQVELTITLDSPDATYSPLGQTTAGQAILTNGYLNRPVGGVYDAQGVLWILNGNDGKIIRVAPNGSGSYDSSVWLDPRDLAPTPYPTNPFPNPVGLAIDAAGNLYVLNAQTTIYKIDTSKVPTKITTNQNNQVAIASNGSNLLYVSLATQTASIVTVDVNTQAVAPFVGAGFSQPAGVAVASDGTAYVSSAGNTIVKMSPGGVITTFLSSGLSGPKGLAITPAGDLLIADSGTNTILKASTTSAPTLPLPVYASGTNLSSPGPMALASDGALFVGNAGNNTIALVPPGGGTAQSFARSLVQNATGMTYDSGGNLYAVGGVGDVVKVDAAGNVTSLNRLPGAQAVAVGPSGNILVSVSNNTIVPYPSNGSDIITGLNSPSGMAFAGGTSMYVAERFANRISLVDTATKTITPFAQSFVNSGDDLYVAPNGDRYILNNNRIDHVGATSGATLPASGLPFSAQAMLPNPAGGFYLEEPSALKSMDASGVVTAISALTTLPTLAFGMAFDGSGNLLVGDRFGRQILKVNPATGVVATFADLTGVSTSQLWTLTGDGSGGVFANMTDGKIVRVPAGGGNITLLTTIQFAFAERLAFDSANGVVYVKTSTDVRSFALATPNQVTTLPIPGSSAGMLQFVNGRIQLTTDLADLRAYTPQGVLVSTLAGFNQPASIVFDGTRLIVADTAKTISVVPGQLPTTLADETVIALTLSQGAIYGTRGAAILTLPAGSRTYATYYAPTNIGLGTLSAIAARGDGAFSFASRDDERVLTINASKQVVASYAGVNGPTSIATDASGNVYVSMGFRQMDRINRSTGQSFVIDPFTSSSALAFFNGQLHAATNGRLLRYAADGTLTQVFSDPAAFYSAMYVTSSGLFIADGAQLKISRWDGTAMTQLASGLVGIDALVVGKDGALYAGGTAGSVTRVSGTSITLLSGDLGYVTSLGVGPSGRIYAGTLFGDISAFDPVTRVRSDLTNIAQIASVAGNRGPAAQFVTADSSEVLAIGVGNGPTEVYRVTYTPPPAPPAAGTLVYSTRMNVPDLAVGATQAVTGIPPWPIPYPGDFRFSIHRVDTATGEGVNILHVGPAATGTITAGASRVPPGNPSVHVTARLQGADFVSVSKVDVSRAAFVTPAGIARAMGADAMGRIYLGVGNVLRSKATGGFEQIWSPPTGGGGGTGSVPVDNNQNFYAIGGPGNKEIFGVSSTTLQQVSHNTLPEQIISIVRDSQDTIWALTTTPDPTISLDVGHIWHVVPNGAVTLLNTGSMRTPFSLAIDGRDNLYVHTAGGGPAIYRVTRDGSTSITILADNNGEPSFEYEGVNMTGDCADNIIVTPFSWKKYGQGAGWPFPQIEEEHTLVQVNGTTGKVTQIFDGLQFSTDLSDMDAVVYDRFAGQLLILSERWVTTDATVIYRIPLTCGAISTDFHVVVPPGQSASGYSVAPNSIVGRSDGSNELVWNLKDLQNSGQSLSFDTALVNLGLGEARAVASEAFLLFQDTFVANQVKVPLAVPTVTADGLVDAGVSVSPSSYPANTPISGTVTLTSRDPNQSHSVNLVISVTDAQGAVVAQVGQQSMTIAAGAVVPIAVAFNTGTYLAGSYFVKADVFDAATGISTSSASAGFDILSDTTVALASLSSDKLNYQPVDTVTLDARAKNASVNTVLSGLTLAIVVRDPSNAVVLSDSRAVNVLVPQSAQDAFFVIRLSGAAAGTYTAQLTLSSGAGVLDTRSITFTVLSTVDTGSGLQGSLTATRFANAGDTVSLVATLVDRGNAPLSNLPITFSVVNPTTGAVVQQFSTAASLAQGAQTQVTQSWNTTGVAAGLYVAAASATFGGRVVSLGQSNITIGAIQPFAFIAVTGAPLNTIVASNPVTIAGIVVPAPISIAGGQFRIGAGAYASGNATVNAGDVVTVAVTSAATSNTTATATLTVAGFSAPFSVTTVSQHITPDPFSFTPVSNAAPGSLQTSNTVTITGIDIAVPISIAGGAYRVNGGAFTGAAGTVNNGDTVTVQLAAAATLGTTTTATLTVSNVSAGFSVTTTTAQATPNAFSFTPQTNVARSMVVTSNTVTITGINAAVPISVTGGSYSVNGGAFTTAPGSVVNGNTVALRQTSSANFSITTTATLTVSGVSGSFAVTTAAPSTTPNPFAFTALTNVTAGSTQTSNTVTITGIDIPVSISIVGGTYSLNGGAFTSAAGMISSGNTVAVRLVASSTAGATVTATLTVSTVSAAFTVTTSATSVNPFSFTPQVNVPLSTPIVSNSATITGITTSVPISVAGAQYKVNAGAFTATAGTVNNNDVVSMRLTSSGSYSTPVSGNLTVSQFSTGFTVTTMARPDPTVSHGFSSAPRVLVLVSCKNAQGAEDYACEGLRRDFIDQYLTGLGISHRVVTDTETFRSELRCGAWNTFWISGGAAKLKDTLAREVREAVFHGGALLVDGAHDSTSATLDPVTGVTTVVTATESPTVLLSGSILPVGTFTQSGGGLRVALQGGTANANFGTVSGDVAIVSHAYGNGRAMQFAFDLTGTLMAQPTSTLLQGVVGQAIRWMSLAPAAAFSGDAYVPIVTTVANTAVVAQEVQVVATLPAGFTLLSSVPAAQSSTSTTITWHMTLAPQSSVAIAWNVRTPQATGSYSISFVLSRIENTQTTAIGTTTLAFPVTVLADESSQAVSTLNTLPLTLTAERTARDTAASDVLAAQTKAGQGMYEEALDTYLDAGDLLQAITSVPTATSRAAIDQLLQEASRDWCRGGTACVPGTATGSSYGVIVFGSASLSNGSSTGSVGVGGAASLSSYTVASNLSGDGARFVGASSLSWSNGSVGIGGSGVIRVVGAATVNANVGRRELTNTAVEDWTALKTDQLARSDRFAAMTGTAATTGAGGAVNCTGTNAAWNVCTISSTQLNGAHSINLTYPATANVLVNITGGAATVTNGQTNFNGAPLQNNALAKQVIFNAAQLGSLSISSWGWGGTLLAPRASVSQTNTTIDGQAVFNTVSSSGNSYSCSGIFNGVTP